MAYGIVNADQIQSSVTGVSLGAGNASIMKNRIINGECVVNQYALGTFTPTIGVATYIIDRWNTYQTQSSKFTIQQSSTAPVGFINSLLVTSSSAYSVASGDTFTVQQYIEGLNCRDLAWGTANAKTVTLSFWVQSSLTGTFGGALSNSAVSRSYPFTYSIPAANTWTQISVTIAGDTTGTWLTTNGVGIRVYFGLGVGTTQSGTAGAWAGAQYQSATGATSVVGTNGATFYITGVQLEVGSSATGFEYRQYQQELALCQRYLPALSNLGTNGQLPLTGNCTSSATQALLTYNFVVPTRVSPTGITVNNIAYFQGGIPGITSDSVLTAIAFNQATPYAALILITQTASNLSNGLGYSLRTNNSAATLYLTGCEL